MESDPKQVVNNVEEALLKDLDRRLADVRESMVRDLRTEVEGLRGAIAQMPQVMPLLQAAGTQAPDYCQAGSFLLPPLVRGAWNTDPHYTGRPAPVINQVQFERRYNDGGHGHDQIQTAPYQGIAAAEVVRAMSGKGLEDGRRYRYVFMAWAEPSEETATDERSATVGD